MSSSWRGVFPAATTHFTADHSVDIHATLQHLDALVAAGASGMIVLGTVGENSSLEWGEKLDVLKAAVAQLRGRVPLIAGVAECTTAQAARFAEAAAASGADGLMLLPALNYRSDPRETIVHFRCVARCTSLPIMVYNNPAAYGVDITPEIFDELADEPRLVAIKESSEDSRRITDIKRRCGNRYTLFCGIDDLALESAMLGAVGWVSGLVNAFPAESCRLWDLAMAGRYDEAVELYRWFAPLLHLDTHPKLVQYIKLAAAECGLGSEHVRPPRLPLVEPERGQILAIIRQAIESRPSLLRHDVPPPKAAVIAKSRSASPGRTTR